MSRWFERLPIHRKLVVSALSITAVALLIAMTGLSAFDAWRYRATAADDAAALARVLAENTAAAVMFKETDAAREMLQSVRVRSVVSRACIYLPGGTLFAGFSRTTSSCPDRLQAGQGWEGVVGVATIRRNDRAYGEVYVERSLSDLRGRVLLTALAGLLMFAVAASAAYLLAQRVNASISGPISALARFARTFGDSQAGDPPPMRAAPDELGDLVASFSQMVNRVRSTSDDLRRSNEALLHEQAEREAALAREREANRLKDEFLAAVSHELRTPLNAMMGWAQVLAVTKPSEDTLRKALASIVKNAQAQTRVVEDLIDVSRITTGNLRLRFEPLDVRGVAAGAVESLEPVAAAKGVRLQLVIPDEACFVAGDSDRLQQVLWNLLSNGVKFTKRGGSVTAQVSREDGTVRVRVIDTGMGIAEGFLPHVFERFRQFDGSMTRAHGGLGLGLAIVKELTELHGGSVSVASDGPNRGATFSIALPECEAPPAAAPGRRPAIVAADGLPLAGIAVTAVDDDGDAVSVVAATLTCAGAVVQTFTAPEDALHAWEQGRSDVLVCDLAMPGMSGMELLGQIRHLDAKRGSFTPAVAVSAHASEQHQADSRAAGFQVHVAKPFDRDDLIAAVVQILAKA
jgi:signal transduction histidine kinase/CheY-like chemotaxis protein